MTLWAVPREWEGETAFLLGGGPSLRGFDASILRGKGRVVAINDAGLIMAPWADVLFWADPRWLDWNASELHLHVGAYKVSRSDLALRVKDCTPKHSRFIAQVCRDLGVKRVRHQRRETLCMAPNEVAGSCSGGSAINLAFHFGPSRIVCLGFDMSGGGNWHDRHKQHAMNEKTYVSTYIPAIDRMAPVLKKRGVEVLNATPGSALRCFPYVELGDVL